MAKTKRKKNVLESPKRLSESMVWDLQRGYYDRQALNAWSGGDVPFWITSNPFIAHAYARIIVGFLKDCLADSRNTGPGRIHRTAPVYIVELGSGTGQLAWHLVRELRALTDSLGLQEITCKVVLTDFTINNLKAWEQKPHWKALLKEGRVDFARFDADHPDRLRLRHSGEVLEKGAVRNPLVLIANYLFDTIRQDAFSVEDGRLYETRVALAYQREGPPNLDDSKLFNKMKFRETKLPISGSYYDDPDWDAVLNGYRRSLKEADFMIPVGAFQCIRHFLRMSDSRLLLLCGDKCYRNEREVGEGLGAHLTPHGSFSTMVNGDAIGKYFERLGGVALQCEHGENTFTNSVFVAGGRRKTRGAAHLKLPETRTACRLAIDGFNPADYVKVFENLYKRLKNPPLETLLALLRLSHWDTEIFSDFEDALEAKLPNVPDELRADLRQALLNVWEHHFPLNPKDDDVAFKIGRLIFGLGDYRKALELFKYSHKHAEEHCATWFNIGLCQARLGKPRLAWDCYEKSLSLNPRYERARIELNSMKNRS